MKKYTATYFRSNPQLTNGGYITTREIEARSIVSARKKANEIADNNLYGGMQLINVVLVENKSYYGGVNSNGQTN